MSMPLYLDDLMVGTEFISGERALSSEDIREFAGQFDPQPFHVDDAAAQESFFSGLAASGWHTAALTMRLLTESVPLGGGIIGAGAQISWPLPTRPGDRLHVESRVTEVKPSRSKPDRGMVTFECLTKNQDNNVCQRMVTTLLVMRKPEQR